MIRFYFALWAAKAAKVLIRLFHKVIKKEGTNFPGIVALKLCPNILARIVKPRTVIAVTGTNGKTTMTNMISDCLEAAGYDVTSNRLGSNIITGITAALVNNATLFNKSKHDIGVLEVDERSSILVYEHVKPTYLVCTNLSRDSLSRNPHPHYIFDVVQKGLPKTTKLILNADDLISARLKTDQKNVYYGTGHMEGDSDKCRNIVNDIQVCPVCHTPLVYDYVHYNHIGRAHCPSCGFASPKPDYEAVSFDYGTMRMQVRDKNGKTYSYHMISNSIFNLYNEVTVIAFLREFGIEPEKLIDILENVSIVSTRYRNSTVEGIDVISNMAKGQISTACSVAFDYVSKQPKEKEIVMMLEDAHFGDSENLTYIYDTDFEFLNDEKIYNIVAVGKRAQDFVFRMLVAGIPKERLHAVAQMKDLAPELVLKDGEAVYILYDNYSVDLENEARDIIENTIRERKSHA